MRLFIAAKVGFALCILGATDLAIDSGELEVRLNQGRLHGECVSQRVDGGGEVPELQRWTGPLRSTYAPLESPCATRVFVELACLLPIFKFRAGFGEKECCLDVVWISLESGLEAG